MWQGLGYYSRARNLLFSAKHIYNDLGSKFPVTYNEIIKLKGVGDYTASAIASICFEEQTPVLDGNVYRVLSRIFELENPINLSSSRKIFKENVKMCKISSHIISSMPADVLYINILTYFTSYTSVWLIFQK